MFRRLLRNFALALGVALAFACPSRAQTTTTNTNCTSIGDNINCNSTSTSNAAQQQQAYEAGQKVGDAIGGGIALAMASHSKNSWVRKFCAAHPGESWKWTRNADGALLDSGHCETDDDKALAAANTFMSHTWTVTTWTRAKRSPTNGRTKTSSGTANCNCTQNRQTDRARRELR